MQLEDILLSISYQLSRYQLVIKTLMDCIMGLVNQITKAWKSSPRSFNASTCRHPKYEQCTGMLRGAAPLEVTETEHWYEFKMIHISWANIDQSHQNTGTEKSETRIDSCLLSTADILGCNLSSEEFLNLCNRLGLVAVAQSVVLSVWTPFHSYLSANFARQF